MAYKDPYAMPSKDDIEFLRKAYVGKSIHINAMVGEPQYSGREGTVRFVDDFGQLHGDWGGLAVNPRCDSVAVL